MKSISHKTLLKKSIGHRNSVEYFRLANIEANREWGQTSASTPTPSFLAEKPDKKKRAWGLLTALRQALP